ncbi:MAG: hypothetical protein H0U28_06210 [Nocardioidaceae bacterium]|nr:hypothetical protein [Nocardioidaceae bacterium]
MLRRSLVSFASVLTASVLPLAAATAPTWGVASEGAPRTFRQLSTFAVAGQVAEILAVTPNGRTLLYTDSAEQELGLVDLTRPDKA